MNPRGPARQMPSTQTLRAILPRSARDLAGFQLEAELRQNTWQFTPDLSVFSNVASGNPLEMKVKEWENMENQLEIMHSYI